MKDKEKNILIKAKQNNKKMLFLKFAYTIGEKAKDSRFQKLKAHLTYSIWKHHNSSFLVYNFICSLQNKHSMC